MSTFWSKKRKGKAVGQYDSSKFVSENTQDRYFDSVSKRNPIAERGLCLTGIDWPNITANIQKRGWDNFCAQPLSAIVSVIREFYVNVLEHNNQKINV